MTQSVILGEVLMIVLAEILVWLVVTQWVILGELLVILLADAVGDAVGDIG